MGDGLLGLLQPERHLALWRERALGAQVTVKPFDRRLYGLVQIDAGLAPAARLKSKE